MKAGQSSREWVSWSSSSRMSTVRFKNHASSCTAGRDDGGDDGGSRELYVVSFFLFGPGHRYILHASNE